MNELVPASLALLAGAALGLVFFGGLWWTVKRGGASRRPALWFLLSFAARTGIVLAGFYLISVGHWHRLIFCLTGFITARILLIHLLVPARARQIRSEKNRSHAP